jgi:hypothetical protein
VYVNFISFDGLKESEDIDHIQTKSGTDFKGSNILFNVIFV